jgi:hypothetical protein
MDDAARFHGLLNECRQTVGRGVCDALHSNSPNAPSVLLSRNDNQRFCFRVTTSGTLLGAANVRLIHLNAPRKSVSVRANHRQPKFVEHCPDRLALHTELTLKPQGADSGLLTRDKPHGAEPKSRWKTRPVENGSRRRRHLVMAISTFQQPSPSIEPRMPRLAAGTAETIGPPKPGQVFQIIRSPEWNQLQPLWNHRRAAAPSRRFSRGTRNDEQIGRFPNRASPLPAHSP